MREAGRALFTPARLDFALVPAYEGAMGCADPGRALARVFLFICIAAIAAGIAAGAEARVERLEIVERSAFADGLAFGATGPYERIVGRLHYSVDPDDPANARIVDLALAPRDESGRVSFVGDFIMLKPADPARGNRRLLYEVNNRSNLGMLGFFNFALWSNRPSGASTAATDCRYLRGFL